MPNGASGPSGDLRPRGTCRDRWPSQRAAGGLLAVALLVGAPAGLARVTLDTAVSKVETTLEETGRVKRQLMPAEEVASGEELRYTITFTNESEMRVDAERVVITNPIPEGTRYVAGTAGGDFARVEYSADGESFSASEPAPAADSAGGGPAPSAQAEQGGAADLGIQSLRWTYLRDLQPGEAGEVYFHVRMQ